MSTIAAAADFLRTLAQSAVRLALPPACVLCGAPGQPPDLDLCDVCATFLPVLPDARSPPSGLPDREHECGPVAAPFIEGGTVVRMLCFFKYAYPVDHFVRAMKFRGDRVFARLLGTLMARLHRAAGAALPDVLIPMPLHPTRYRQRGFNQALEIARTVSSILRVPVDTRCLVRRLATREQSGLTLEARHRNVRGAFEVARPLPAGRIALLDDVVTTGSTAAAAMDVLIDAGARHIELWAAARAERHPDGRADEGWPAQRLMP